MILQEGDISLCDQAQDLVISFSSPVSKEEKENLVY